MEWLCRTQGKDGRWDTIAYGSEISGDIEQTSLAIFAFLGAGHTEKVGLYRENVQSAISWLLRHQREDGAILPPGWSEVDGLRHALGGLALAEAASMSRMPITRAAAQKAVDYSLRHQSKVGEALSGFGRQAQSASPDLLSTAFFTMQLKSAKVMGLKVDPMAFDGIIRFLDSVDAKNVKEGGFFSYVQDGKATPEATLIGCAVRRFLGWKREDLALQAGAAVKAFGNPTVGQVESNAVVNYFGTL
ncbi:MAG: terpene cyclase/mutase family protein, partial [Planctomycetes bacterium]|nr:terpene cyclase/mutase family protein [Planctomycetota bacterium]